MLHAHRRVVGFALLFLIPCAAAQDLTLKPEDPASAVHPRKFGVPGGIGQTRGWYVWRSFDAKSGFAEVSHEASGEKSTVRVLPWLTTYRHLAYGAHPDDLLPGERVNLFFNPDSKQKRAYLVHFQDEMCQMKGHNHAWEVTKVMDGGFSARGIAGEKPLDDQPTTFTFDAKCKFWREGKLIAANVKAGERLLLTWCYEGDRRVVKLLSDASSLDAIQKEARQRIQTRIKKDGMTGFVEEAAKDKTQILIFATWWQQANDLKPSDAIRVQHENADPITAKLVARKNLGTYGSGCTVLTLDSLDAKQLETLRGWTGGRVVRVFGP